jgi:hypothetical protein
MARRRSERGLVQNDRGGADRQACYPTADQIAERAHELFISGGRRISRIPEYWRNAEAELLELAAQRVLGVSRRR